MGSGGKATASAVAGALLWGTLGPVAALFNTGDRIAAGGIRLAVGALVLVVVARGRPLRGLWRTRADGLESVGVAEAGQAGTDALASAGSTSGRSRRGLWRTRSRIRADALASAGGVRGRLGPGVRRAGSWTRADVGPLVGGAVGIAGFQVAYFGAIGSAGVAVSTAVGIGLSPVFTGLWTAITERRVPSAGWMVGTAVAVGGLCLLALTKAVTFSLVGLGLSVLAAAFFSLQAVSIQALTKRHDEATALTGILALGAVLMTPVIVTTATAELLTVQGIAGVGYLGVVTTGLSYWLFARGIKHIGAAAAVTITLLEPAAAAVIAAVALHEELSAGQWAGIVLIGAAIAITGRTPKRPEPVGSDLRQTVLSRPGAEF
ncbi:DMT family transporter [Kutzneria chonburiensis]|uniref:DMT family transporter n=1 Tax=Kutzneria chonburiensis TaxID=1483604 RepID=A0ABV6MLK0_9PSEU|nr:EamA family transporter [Kutzneria chonburiensis]